MSKGKKSRFDMTHAKFARFLEERRGQGAGASYRPWIQINDLSSKGRVHRTASDLTGFRTHHLLSDNELFAYVNAWWRPEVIDIREQYPRGRASVSHLGIGFATRFYETPRAIQEEWFDKARKANYTVDVAYDPENPEKLFVIHADQTMERTTLRKTGPQYDDTVCLTEIYALKKDAAKNLSDAFDDFEEAKQELRDGTDAIIAKANAEREAAMAANSSAGWTSRPAARSRSTRRSSSRMADGHVGVTLAAGRTAFSSDVKIGNIGQRPRRHESYSFSLRPAASRLPVRSHQLPFSPGICGSASPPKQPILDV